jgi:3-hydroxy-9,10-secoandrosta-1,3,5(10)-triene-9,17-dione monooxygenase
VGIAQGAVENFIERYSGTSGTGRTAESSAVQIRLAESSVEVDTARLIVEHDTRRIVERAAAGEMLGDADALRFRRNVSYVSRLCCSAVDRLFEASGARSLYDSDPMQRCHRDVHAGAHQTALYWDTNAEAYGRAAFGLPPLQPVLPAVNQVRQKESER